MFLLHGETLHIGHGCGYYLLFTLRENHEEEKFHGLGKDHPAFLSRDQRNVGR
jgi:hypothetical protein